MARTVVCIINLLVLCVGLYAGGTSEVDTRGMTLVENLSSADPWLTARDHARIAADLRFSREVAKSRVDGPFQSINGEFEFETAITYDDYGNRNTRLVRSLKNGEPISEDELNRGGVSFGFGAGQPSVNENSQDTENTGQTRSTVQTDEPFDISAEGRVWVRPIRGIVQVDGKPCRVYEFIVIDRELKNPRKPTGYRGKVWISRDTSFPIQMEYSFSVNESGMAMGTDVRQYWRLQGNHLVPVGRDLRIQMSFLLARITVDLEQRFFDLIVSDTMQ